MAHSIAHVPLADEAGRLGRQAQRRRGIPQATLHARLVQLRRGVGTKQRALAKAEQAWHATRKEAFIALLLRRTVDGDTVTADAAGASIAFPVASDAVWLEAVPVHVRDTYGPLTVYSERRKRTYYIVIQAADDVLLRSGLRKLGVSTSALGRASSDT